MAHVYSDDSPNYGEDRYSLAQRWLEEATDRVDDTYKRIRREVRGKVHPLRYEALLRRIENVSIELGSGGCEAARSAQRRLDELDDDVAIMLAAPQTTRAELDDEDHPYREDEEGYGEYGLGTEEWLVGTSKRLERLRVRLRRDLRGKLPAQEYDALCNRVVRATTEYRGGLREAMAAAERAVSELRAEIDARAAELET